MSIKVFVLKPWLGNTYDVTMHQPGPWIIGSEGDDEPAAAWQCSRLPARGVVEFQGVAGRPYAAPGAQDEEPVTVQMDGVGDLDCGTGCFLDDPVDPLICAQF